MQKECPYITQCPMFKKLRLTKQIFISNYCKGDYEKCVRKAKRDRGENVPDNLLPSGEYLRV